MTAHENIASILISGRHVECAVAYVNSGASPLRQNGSRDPGYLPVIKGRKTHTIEAADLGAAELIERACAWIFDQSENIRSIVAGSFGPFESLNHAYRNRDTSSDAYNRYGRVKTELPHHERWSDFNLYQGVLKAIPDKVKNKVRVRVQTRVDLSALGEFAGRMDLAVAEGRIASGEEAKYISGAVLTFIHIGQAINGGIAYSGEIWRGRAHPMMHIVKPRRYHYPDGSVDDFEGVCPYHGDCLEGLIGNHAIMERYNQRGHDAKDLSEIPITDPVWECVAHYIASLCVDITAILAPSVIVLDGPVFQKIPEKEALHFLVARAFVQQNNGRLDRLHRMVTRADGYIQPSRVAAAGLWGGLVIAARELHEENKMNGA